MTVIKINNIVLIIILLLLSCSQSKSNSTEPGIIAALTGRGNSTVANQESETRPPADPAISSTPAPLSIFFPKNDPNTIPVSDWTRLKGANGKNSYGYETAADSAGNVYSVGSTNGNIGAQSLTGSVDLIITKYDSNGVELWTRLKGVSGKATEGFGIAIDNSDNVYVTGYTSGDLDGQTFSNTLPSTAFLSKLDSSGNTLWTRLSNTNNGVEMTFALSAAIDSTGIYITGFSKMTTTPPEKYSAFIEKYNFNGTRQWTSHQEVTSGSYTVTVGVGLATDNSGVFMTGYTDGSLTGSPSLIGTDFFLTKFDTSGVRQWTNQIGGAYGTSGFGLSIVSSSGNLFVLGAAQCISSHFVCNFDGKQVAGESTYYGTSGWILSTDLFLSAFDSAGNKQWSKLLNIGGSESLVGRGLVVDNAGRLVLTNYHKIIQYDLSGNLQSSILLNDGNTYAESISIDNLNNIYLTGYASFPTHGQTLSGITDLFIKRYKF